MITTILILLLTLYTDYVKETLRKWKFFVSEIKSVTDLLNSEESCVCIYLVCGNTMYVSTCQVELVL